LIIIKLQGGLGNQMFQYAFGKSLSKQLNCSLYLDPSFFVPQPIEVDITPRRYELNIFEADISFASEKMISQFFHPGLFQRVLNKLNTAKKILHKESSLLVDHEVFKMKPPVYFDGFWQSEKYFSDNENLIRKVFKFKKPLSIHSQKLATEILKCENAVSVHIRRGDYISSERTNQIHGTCSVAYYINAISLLKSKLNKLYFYFFSDDPEWVIGNLVQNLQNYEVVKHNTGDDSWQDMALMSRCKHHIIANSSFSWWGAWLNPDKEKIVIAPENWFKIKTDYHNISDLLPGNWVKLKNE
jgi:hypothetical protein